MTRRNGLLFALVACLAFGRAFATQVEPTTRSVTYTLNGREFTRYFELSRTEGGALRVIETTGPGGQQVTATENYARTSTGATRHRTTTGPNGRSATSDSEWIMNAMGYTKVTTGTGPRGGNWRSTKVATRTGEGSRTVENTVIGPDGAVYTVNRQGQRTESGWNSDAVITGPNGEVVTRSDTWQKTGDNSWTRKTTTTFPQGAKTVRTRDGERDGSNVKIEQKRDRSGTKPMAAPSQAGKSKVRAMASVPKAARQPKRKG
ncbi:MAG: hypothetical protein KIT11_04235 [Fimbriimonadaceae bacterium]|nr:hypothetical protein [Fimbriimonadaceae bacterium]QYK56896.1 MAG: hypothetical protein KF733_05290 [Fimbriimonadaceae bacterium]